MLCSYKDPLSLTCFYLEPARTSHWTFCGATAGNCIFATIVDELPASLQGPVADL